jgi:hypothetical protein
MKMNDPMGARSRLSPSWKVESAAQNQEELALAAVDVRARPTPGRDLVAPYAERATGLLGGGEHLGHE